MIGHEIPVNTQARMLLAKAPWWAFAPAEDKKEIEVQAETAISKCGMEHFVNCFSAPPIMNDFARGQQIKDRRGEKIGGLRVLGYAGYVTKSGGRMHGSYQGIARQQKLSHIERDNQWYCLHDGAIIVVRTSKLSSAKSRLKSGLQVFPKARRKWTKEERVKYNETGEFPIDDPPWRMDDPAPQ